MKKLIGSDIGAYSFDPVARTITITGLPAFDLANILLITNVSAGLLLYSFADDALGGTVVDGIITLDYDTSTMSGADKLQIWLDLPQVASLGEELFSLDPAFVTDTNLMNVLGSQPVVDYDGLKCKTTAWASKRTIGSLIGTNSELRIDCTGMNTAAIQIAGTWSGSISFQASINGADFAGAGVAALIGTSGAQNTNGNGQFLLNCSGLAYVRVIFATYSSGTAMVTMVASAARPMCVSYPSSQVTADSQLPTIFGATGLYAPAHTDLGQQIVNPIVNPTQPTSYAEPKFAIYPQKYRRLRVQIGGDQSLPCAQEPGTNRLIVATPDLYAKLEELLMQQTLTNQLLALAFNLSLPSGTKEIN